MPIPSKKSKENCLLEKKKKYLFNQADSRFNEKQTFTVNKAIFGSSTLNFSYLLITEIKYTKKTSRRCLVQDAYTRGI